MESPAALTQALDMPMTAESPPATRAELRRLARFELDLYRYGLRMGAAMARRGRTKRALIHLVQPIPYWRSLEYRMVWGAAGFERDDRVLDIGSPKLLSLYLADRVGAEVWSTDLEDYFVDEYTYLREVRRVPAGRFHVEVADGRALPYADESFTKIYAISVIEHIPEGGDSDCLREIARTLRPGGRCFLTVPFSPKARDIYRSPQFYWAGSSPSSDDGLVFFQHRYSEDDLQKRLIDPSGMRPARRLYVGERFSIGRRDRELSELKVPMLVTSPIHPLVSRVGHTRPTPDWRDLEKPVFAFLELYKPER